MQRIIKLVMSALPLVIIASLLYAGFFIKPKPVAGDVRQLVLERADKFYGLAFSPTGALWTVGSNGKILHSEDQEKSWQLQSTLSHLALQDVAAWDAQRAVAVGDDGVVMTTVNGGKVWGAVDAPRSDIANKLIRVKATSDGNGWAVGEGGAVLRSTDFGATWKQIGAPEDVAWNDIAFQNQRGVTVGVMVGEFGRIRLSNDGGQTWTALASPVKSSLNAVAFKDADNAIAVGLGGVVLRSQDGGASWTQETSVTQEHVFDVVWDGDRSRWIAVGDKGVLLVGNAAGDVWRAVRNPATGRGWYTRIVQREGRYYFAGSGLVTLEANAL